MSSIPQFTTKPPFGDDDDNGRIDNSFSLVGDLGGLDLRPSDCVCEEKDICKGCSGCRCDETTNRVDGDYFVPFHDGFCRFCSGEYEANVAFYTYWNVRHIFRTNCVRCNLCLSGEVASCNDCFVYYCQSCLIGDEREGGLGEMSCCEVCGWNGYRKLCIKG